ncbi:MAG: flagellar basal body P-ring protein FlgI [Planctomycetota bacterium]
MRQASNMATLWVVVFFLSASAIRAGQEPAAEDAPAAVPAAAEVPAADTAAAEKPAAEPAKVEPASAEPARLDATATAEVAQVLARMRQEVQGNRLIVGDICEVKHYEVDELQGFGLVLDLEGLAGEKESTSTAEEATAAPAVRLTELLTLLNAPVGEGDVQPIVPEQFRAADQVTLVAVTAVIPPEGLKKSDRIDCEVRAVGGRGVQNGYLLLTQLSPPGPRKEGPAALAAGPIVAQSSVRSRPSKVSGGCLAMADISDEFVKDEKITLILGEEYADFPVAQDLVNLINTEMGIAANQPLAKASNRHNVEVTVPAEFAEDPVAFVTLVLRLETKIPAPEKGVREYGAR